MESTSPATVPVWVRLLAESSRAADAIAAASGTTPSPDDLVSIALAGTDTTPAIPGYDPDLSADLYTTNGDTTGHASNVRGVVGFTPEMSTCQTASAIDPDDAFDPDDCESVFNFPDSEPLIQDEFLKNIPFALSVAKSAVTPDTPVSSVGVTAPNFQIDSFATSYGDPQPVAVTARRSLTGLKLNYRIDGGPVKTAATKEWAGGKRYGGTDDIYYAEYRGTVTGAKPGSKVESWFTAAAKGKAVQSAHFTYTRARVATAPVLVVSNEDYRGVNPTYPPSVTGPKYAKTYVDALKAAGIPSVVWDVTKQGVPHHLGVLGHYQAVVWYLGDNRLTEDARDETTNFLGDELPDLAVTRATQQLTISMRDYLNEGGRLLYTGETAGYYGLLGNQGLGGIYYGLDDAPDEECVVVEDPFSDCAVLSDDFTQYYLGAYGRVPNGDAVGVKGTSTPFTGFAGTFGGPATVANPIDEAGNFTATSDVLPVSEFPQFTSSLSSIYTSAGGVSPFNPSQGDWYAAALHKDDSYARLTRTVDLAGVSAAGAPSLRFALDYDTEQGYDNVIVEAHTVGQDDWTTLPEAGGATSTAVPAECEAGFLLEEHPFLEHYLTLGDTCAATGTTGSWNAFTGSSGGPKQVSFDLSAYAGTSVEVSISYVTDPSTGGVGVTVDDTRIIVGGTATLPEGFETSLGAWSVTGPPEGSPDGGTMFERRQAVVGASVTTPSTVLLGYGLEQLATPAQRAAVMGTQMKSLLTR